MTEPLKLSHDSLLDLYRNCMRYGIIHYCEDKVHWNGDFETIKVCRLEDKVYLFSCINGDVQSVIEC